jgi:hypothetical protein
LGRVSTEDAGEVLRRGLAETPEVAALDALRDVAELVALLSGWQWEAMHSERLAGASWDEIGAAVGVRGGDARDRFLEVLENQEVLSLGSAARCRDVA